MRAGETIHTENSHKYGHRDGRVLLLRGRLGRGAGMDRRGAEWFAIILAEAEPPRFAP